MRGFEEPAIAKPVVETLRPALDRGQPRTIAHIEAVPAAGIDVRFDWHLRLAILLGQANDDIAVPAVIIGYEQESRRSIRWDRGGDPERPRIDHYHEVGAGTQFFDRI